MTPQSENAIRLYRKQLEKALEAAPRNVRIEAVEDADEFLADDVLAMDVGRLSSQDAAYQRFVDRFGTPEQLAATYMEQSVTVPTICGRRPWKRVVVAMMLFMLASGERCLCDATRTAQVVAVHQRAICSGPRDGDLRRIRLSVA